MQSTLDASNEMWFGWVGPDFLVVAHTNKRPEAAIWTDMCRGIGEALRQSDVVRTLVFTDGGGPSGAQRDEMALAVKGKKHRISVVSRAATARFIVSSMALFNPTIKSFSPEEWRLGLAHLKASPSEIQKIEQALDQLVPRFTTASEALRVGSR